MEEAFTMKTIRVTCSYHNSKVEKTYFFNIFFKVEKAFHITSKYEVLSF